MSVKVEKPETGGLDYTKDAPAELYLGGYPNSNESDRVPIVNGGVTLHERTDGPIDLTRIVQVEVPIEFYETNWESVTRSKMGEIATLRLYDESLDEFGVPFVGTVTGVGAAGTNTLELQIKSPSLTLTEQGLSYSIGRNTPNQSILDKITSHIERVHPQYDSVDYEIPNEVGGKDNTPTEKSAQRSLDFVDRYPQVSKQFTRDKNSINDLISTLSSVYPLRAQFTPSVGDDDDVTLRLEANSEGTIRDAEHLGGDVAVFENNALAKIAPINQLRLEGVTGDVLRGLGQEVHISEMNDTYPYAVVNYPKLKNLAGGAIEAQETVKLTDTDAVQRRAEKMLDNRVLNAEGGEIKTEATPSLSPYNGIQSLPRTEEAVVDSQPISYRITEAKHSYYANERGVHGDSKYTVSLYTNPSSIALADRGTINVN